MRTPVEIQMEKSSSVFNEYRIDVSHMPLADAYWLLAELMKRSRGAGRLVTT